MALPNVDVNYLAVLFAAVASMIWGSLWYGPFFGKRWMTLMGFTKRDIDKAKQKGMGKLYFIAFVSSLVMAFVLSHFVVYTTATSFIGGMITSFWLWLGFIATVSLGSVLWEGKPLELYLINTVYWLVNLVVMGGILAVWR